MPSDTLDLGDGRTVAVLEVGRRYVAVKDQGRRLFAITMERFDALTGAEPASARPAQRVRPLIDDTDDYERLCASIRTT